MIGELCCSILAAAASVDDNDAIREKSRREQEQAQAALDMEKEKTKQQLINGIFSLLSACAQDNNQNGRR